MFYVSIPFNLRITDHQLHLQHYTTCHNWLQLSHAAPQFRARCRCITKAEAVHSFLLKREMSSCKWWSREFHGYPHIIDHARLHCVITNIVRRFRLPKSKMAAIKPELEITFELWAMAPWFWLLPRYFRPWPTHYRNTRWSPQKPEMETAIERNEFATRLQLLNSVTRQCMASSGVLVGRTCRSSRWIKPSARCVQ
jgi:hypothetical protein